MGRAIRLFFVMQLVTRAFGTVIPWIMGFFRSALGFVGFYIYAFWSNIPKVADNLANEWLNTALERGFPREWDRRLYYILWVLAGAVMVAGWVLLSFATVWLVGLVF